MSKFARNLFLAAAVIFQLQLTASQQPPLEASSDYKKISKQDRTYCLTSQIMAKEASETYNDFDINPDITPKARKLIRPFLLPPNHCMRSSMDTIFLSSRATESMESFQKVGFQILFNQPRSFIVVGRHPLLPNYLVKAHLDTNQQLKKGKQGWEWFLNRCIGAKKIQEIIKSHKFKHFRVPKKYIYPLPPEPLPSITSICSKKIIVLLVEDMHLVDSKKNLQCWKKKITKEHLDELYTIISSANGSSYRADNLPFTVKGKIAFIDTEYPDSNPDYRSIRSYLNPEMRQYWDLLVAKGRSSNR